MTRRGLTLSMVTLNVLVAAPALVGAEPVADVEMPLVVRCEEPGAPCGAPVALPPPPVTQPRIPWQRNLSIGLTSGVVAGGVVFGAGFDPGAFIGLDLRLRWSKPGRPWAIGLRLAAMSSLGLTGGHYTADYAGHSSSSVHTTDGIYGGDVGFLFDVHGFWLASGLGVTHYRQGSYGSTVPETHLGLGYDIPLGKWLAIRLHTSVSSVILSVRAQAGAGLVLRL